MLPQGKEEVALCKNCGEEMLDTAAQIELDRVEGKIFAKKLQKNILKMFTVSIFVSFIIGMIWKLSDL